MSAKIYNTAEITFVGAVTDYDVRANYPGLFTSNVNTIDSGEQHVVAMRASADIYLKINDPTDVRFPLYAGEVRSEDKGSISNIYITTLGACSVWVQTKRA